MENKTLSSCGRRLVADKCPRAASNLTLNLINKPSRGQKVRGNIEYWNFWIQVYLTFPLRLNTLEM